MCNWLSLFSIQAERNFSFEEDGRCSNHIGATDRKVHAQEGQVQMVILSFKIALWQRGIP